MLTLARRLFWLAVLGGVGYALYTTWQRRNEPMPDGPAEWPPFDDVPTPSRGAASTSGAPLPDLGSNAPTDAPLPDLHDRATTRAATPSASSVEAPTSEPAAMPTSEATWVDPTDGTCPVDFPIKGNANSGIYHVPGGRFYERTVPERCYATEDAAVADGYRRAKA
ncbi:MAG: hypothetical protein RIB65_00200 [Ilumatobacter fluminis]|uniref:sunset domain-containing protein n=1 Tax=Ilumatobacter fluminis TaxID=467091 RepID=UPI0032EB860A